jgi:integrase
VAHTPANTPPSMTPRLAGTSKPSAQEREPSSCPKTLWQPTKRQGMEDRTNLRTIVTAGRGLFEGQARGDNIVTAPANPKTKCEQSTVSTEDSADQAIRRAVIPGGLHPAAPTNGALSHKPQLEPHELNASALPEDSLSRLSESPSSGTKTNGLRGFGRPYRRGRIWWIRYSNHGRDIRESAHSARLVDAERLLKARWKQIGRGHFVGPAEERVRVNEMLDALEVDYRNNRRRSLKTLKGRLKPLRDAFGLDRAVEVTEVRIERYKADRLASKSRRGSHVTVATLNRELAALKRAFRLAVEQKRLSGAPTIRLLKENNARQGFVEPAIFDAIAGHLASPLDDIARFAYRSGWRRTEVLTLDWADVDRDGQRVTLRREHSKTGEPRVLPLAGDLRDIIERRWRAREYRTAHGESALSPHVFHRTGRPIVDFRKHWANARAKVGLVGLLFHDLRRSAVRNMDRAGVSQVVAMSITGHKTVSVYQRYRIVNEDDRREALERTQEAMNASPPGNLTPIGKARKSRKQG